MPPDTPSAAEMQEFYVLTVDGKRWTAHARTEASFLKLILASSTLSVFAPGSETPGWTIFTDKIVAYRQVPE